MFLYGMQLIDATIRSMEGRGFSTFLKKYTRTRRGAVLSGLLATAVLQSSSIVNLLLLSFSGAGMMGLRSALGVVLGSNIGGTVNSWLVALLGFKADLGAWSMAMIALSGGALFLLQENSRWNRVFRFVMGIALVLLGLDYAKISMAGLVDSENLNGFAGYPRIVFLLVGFGITSIVQTSAATVMIVLSALYAHAIPLDMGVAIVLGAELGTTIKIVLGSLRGAAVKRRIAAANFAMNLTSTLIGFVFLQQVISLLQWGGLHDPLLLLVAFQSAVNIIGAAIFYFMLNPVADLLGRFFKDDPGLTTRFLQLASVELPQPAVDLLEKEVRYFLLRVLAFDMRFFGIDAGGPARQYLGENLGTDERAPAGETRYNELKASEDEMIVFNAQMRKSALNTQAAIRLNQLMSTVRHGMYAAKALKDVEHNIRAMRRSPADTDARVLLRFHDRMQLFMEAWLRAWNTTDPAKLALELDQLLKYAEKNQEDEAAAIYSRTAETSEKASTLLNVSRETYNACKSLISALRDLRTVNGYEPPVAAGSQAVRQVE